MVTATAATGPPPPPTRPPPGVIHRASCRHVLSSADGAVLLRLWAIAPVSGPLTYPLTVRVQYPAKFKVHDTFDFSYNVDIDTVAP